MVGRPRFWRNSVVFISKSSTRRLRRRCRRPRGCKAQFFFHRDRRNHFDRELQVVARHHHRHIVIRQPQPDRSVKPGCRNPTYQILVQTQDLSRCRNHIPAPVIQRQGSTRALVQRGVQKLLKLLQFDQHGRLAAPDDFSRAIATARVCQGDNGLQQVEIYRAQPRNPLLNSNGSVSLCLFFSSSQLSSNDCKVPGSGARQSRVGKCDTA